MFTSLVFFFRVGVSRCSTPLSKGCSARYRPTVRGRDRSQRRLAVGQFPHVHSARPISAEHCPAGSDSDSRRLPFSVLGRPSQSGARIFKWSFSRNPTLFSLSLAFFFSCPLSKVVRDVGRPR
jgi:hypothetical protein